MRSDMVALTLSRGLRSISAQPALYAIIHLDIHQSTSSRAHHHTIHCILNEPRSPLLVAGATITTSSHLATVYFTTAVAPSPIIRHHSTVS